MLAGELQAYNKRVAAGEVSPVPQPQPPAPPSLAGLHIGSGAPISQSLPSGGHLALVGGRGPPRPRMRPKMPNLSELPILELPEPSPHSNSLLDAPMLRPSFDASVPEEIGEDDEFVGGTCVPAAHHRPCLPLARSPRQTCRYPRLRIFLASVPTGACWSP